MHLHARPHLEVHTRSKSHSAVAGAAYRLGLRLYDERLKVWHDFTKRVIGEEIVLALTVAPNGAPEWATDPAILWNKVELSEKRKDAQVARDYRIPIPFGLTDEDAGELAEEMARFISDELHTPVSIGLHRDAGRDALGEIKPKEKQGFHAHLYFPTRPIVDDNQSDGKEGKDFGAKLAVFAKMNTGSAFIELLNCKWSELATDYAERTGSNVIYQYKSHKRLGSNITPQPTLGRSATAMERKGIYSNRGDTLREALVMAEVYQKAHGDALQAQHAQAVMDVAREAGTASSKNGMAFHPTLNVSGGKRFYPRRQLRVGISTVSTGSMSSRFRSLIPTPQTKAEWEAMQRSIGVVQIIERMLARVAAFERELNDLVKQGARATADKLEAEFQADQFRKRRTNAQQRLVDWEKAHPWRTKVAKMNLSGSNSMHEEHRRLRSKIKMHDGHVQGFKMDMRDHQHRANKIAKTQSALLVKKVEEEAKLKEAIEEAQSLGPTITAQLLAAASVEEQTILKEQMEMLGGDHSNVSEEDTAGRILDTSRRPIP